LLGCPAASQVLYTQTSRRFANLVANAKATATPFHYEENEGIEEIPHNILGNRSVANFFFMSFMVNASSTSKLNKAIGHPIAHGGETLSRRRFNKVDLLLRNSGFAIGCGQKEIHA
jgi:hypothetical protein